MNYWLTNEHGSVDEPVDSHEGIILKVSGLDLARNETLGGGSIHNTVGKIKHHMVGDLGMSLSRQTMANYRVTWYVLLTIYAFMRSKR